MTDEDLDVIQANAKEVIDLIDLRESLSTYLSERVAALAPGANALLGPLVCARLIAHAGSLTRLASAPGSTIQILGAEKALFRAMKTKNNTPKYGLIYHASLVGQASGKNKGKIARMVASKTALALRQDVYGPGGAGASGITELNEEESTEDKLQFGLNTRAHIESKLRRLEGRPLTAKPGAKFAPPEQPGKFTVKNTSKYNQDADALAGNPDVAVPNGVVEDGAEEQESDDQSEEEISKAERKAAKAARKAAKAEKRAAKEAKRAEKEAKRAKKEGKRKREAEDGEVEGKKKKKKTKTDE